jgi:hypothetical protein
MPAQLILSIFVELKHLGTGLARALRRGGEFPETGALWLVHWSVPPVSDAGGYSARGAVMVRMRATQLAGPSAPAAEISSPDSGTRGLLVVSSHAHMTPPRPLL